MEIVFIILTIAVLALYYVHTQQLLKRLVAQVPNGQVSNGQDKAIEISESTIDHLKSVISDLTKERAMDKETVAKLVNAVIAKNASEARDLGLTDKVGKIPAEPQGTGPDLVPLDELSDEEFDKHIGNQLQGLQQESEAEPVEEPTDE